MTVKTRPPQTHQKNGTAQKTPNVTKCGGSPTIWSEWVYVTPGKAEEYLERNTRNRKLIRAASSDYSSDMAESQWEITHQGFAFDVDGVFIDGQNRAEAIRDSGRPQWVLVTWGLSKRAQEVTDKGRPRTMANSLQIMGFEVSDHKDVAVARSMLGGRSHGTTQMIVDGRTVRTTPTMMRTFIEKHLEALTFTKSLNDYARIPTALLGLIARAYYQAPKEELIRFVAAYQDDIPTESQRPGDRTARKLAAFMADPKSMKRNLSNGSSRRTALYRKSQTALRAYLDGKDIERLFERSEELFPLPEETATGLPASAEETKE